MAGRGTKLNHGTRLIVEEIQFFRLDHGLASGSETGKIENLPSVSRVLAQKFPDADAEFLLVRDEENRIGGLRLGNEDAGLRPF